MALAHYLASRYDKALEYATLVVQLRPDWWLALMIYAALAATRKIRKPVRYALTLTGYVRT
jgi:hypothetical protein